MRLLAARSFGEQKRRGGRRCSIHGERCTQRGSSRCWDDSCRTTQSSLSMSATTPYAFGHYFECKANQDILMSGYLGSIGFALPAALGAWAAGRGERKVVSIGGDGGLGADFATAVKYDMSITHIVLNNNELAKISREQVTALRPVWQTSLVNPDFAQFAELCGASGFKVDEPDELEDVLERALAVVGGPSLVEVRTSPRWV